MLALADFVPAQWYASFDSRHFRLIPGSWLKGLKKWQSSLQIASHSETYYCCWGEHSASTLANSIHWRRVHSQHQPFFLSNLKFFFFVLILDNIYWAVNLFFGGFKCAHIPFSYTVFHRFTRHIAKDISLHLFLIQLGV